MMEGDSFGSSDCEDGVTNVNKAVEGVVGQTGVEHMRREAILESWTRRSGKSPFE
jgi:hypothetical protein